MRTLTRKILVWLVPLFLTGLALAEHYDPPIRVARLQLVGGQVSLQPGGVEEWVPARLNRPLTTADRLWSDFDSRAELSIGSAALRVGNETALSIINLDDRIAQFELTQGTLSLWVRFLDRDETIEINTPNIAFTVTRPGEYRIDVNPNEDSTWVQVRRGEGEAYGQEGALIVQPGELFEFTNGQSGQYAVSEAYPRDEFDRWAAQRERRQIQSVSARYCAPGTIGYEALDDAGDWDSMPTYGNVWFPRVAAGWAPYRDGHWAWVEPWGWTWVDDAPWGFAPFHYGRWAFISNRWGWIPGPREVRPVYAPALVAWIGGSNWGISIGIGSGVGWVPLGWRDPYIPWYHVSRDYATRVNITNTRVVNTTIINNYYSTTNVNIRNTTINNIRYENVRVQNAVTAVPSDALVSGRPVRQFARSVAPQQITAQARFASAPAVAPTKVTVFGGRTPIAAPQRIAAPRTVVAKTAPPPPPPSFERQQTLMQKQGGRPLSPEQRRTLQTTAPAPSFRQRPNVVTVTRAPAPKPAGAPGAPPKLEKPASRPEPLVRAAPGGRREAPGVERPAAGERGRPGAPPERPAAGGRPATTPEAGTAERPAPGRPERLERGRPATAPEAGGEERPGGRPERPAVGGRPATTPEAGTAERPAPGRPERLERGRPAAAPEAGGEEGPSDRPERPERLERGRPATAPEERERPMARPPERPERVERPAPAERPERSTERPAPAERTERPGLGGGRPATTPEERPERPAARPAERPERSVERPAPAERPERAVERPAPAQRPAPQAERPAERPAPQAERPAPQAERPAARPAQTPERRQAAPGQEKKDQGKDRGEEGDQEEEEQNQRGRGRDR